MIGDGGVIEFEKKDPLDVSFLQLLDNSAVEQEGAEAQVKEEPPNPRDAIEKFCTARGELDVIIDLVNNLEGGKHVGFKILTGKPRSVNALEELAAGPMRRLGNKRAALQDASKRLQHGAVALRLAADLDNIFYSGIALLQRYWKICQNPTTSEFAGSPFSADIGILPVTDAQAANVSDTTSTSGALGGKAGGGGKPSPAPSTKAPIPTMIPIYKDPSGAVRVQVDRPMLKAGRGDSHTGPRVAVGAREVHTLLLELQQQLLWYIVSMKLDQEATQATASSNYALNLSKRVISAMGSASDVTITALRPMVLDHTVTCKLPNASVSHKPRPYVPPLTSMRLLPELSMWLSHIFFRDHLRQHLDSQVHASPGMQVKWVPTTGQYTSAMELHLTGPQAPIILLLVIQNTTVEVEGIACPRDSTSRWARSAQLTLSRNEIPRVLSVIMATMQDWLQPHGMELQVPLNAQPFTVVET